VRQLKDINYSNTVAALNIGAKSNTVATLNIGPVINKFDLAQSTLPWNKQTIKMIGQHYLTLN
jgi:hypothetical protein